MKKFTGVLFLALVLTSCSMGRNMTPSENNPMDHIPGVTSPAPSDANAEKNDVSTSGSANQSILSEADAKKIALEKVPGAQESDIREWKLDRDDGRQEYEGKIIYEKQEYEFEIDALTGEIIGWDAESVLD